MPNRLLDAAIFYREKMGFSIIPLIPGEKKALIKWKEFQDRKPSIDEVKAWWAKTPNANIGIITGRVNNICVVDFDKYADGYSEEISHEYFPDSIIAPTSATPRGGQHLYFQFPDETITINAGALPGIDFRGEGGVITAPPSANGNGKEYAWMDGLSLSDVQPPALPLLYKKALLNISTLYTRSVDTEGANVQHCTTMPTLYYREGRRDQDLFTIANALVKSRCEDGIIKQTLDILARSCNPPFPITEAEEKIKSAIERANRKDRNLTGDVRDFILSTNGIFLSTFVIKCLHLSTREEQKSLSVVLKRMCNEGLIEKYGSKSGEWRTIDQDEEVIDYLSADVDPYRIRLPLEIHEWVNIHPGNVIVIAGESNAGKSAFCLNVAKMNCAADVVNYMSSEMQDGAELRIRLNKFGDHLSIWKNVKFTFRTDHFTDKIDPDGLNIIDYLDEGTDSEAYKMPMRIRNIADKLRKGIAVVALQKDPNKGLGFGGSGTLNRSRLYITMTRAGILKIEKAKMWRNDNINPNGMFCKFNLIAGAKFMRDGDWKK